MALFDNGKPEGFLLFMQKFITTIDSSGTLTANTKLHYIRMILRGEALRQFYTLCSQVGSKTMAHANQFILVLGPYFFL